MDRFYLLLGKIHLIRELMLYPGVMLNMEKIR